MQVNLSPEAEAKAEKIPDLAKRLESFIEDQFALEEWRARRYSKEERRLTEEVLARADELRASGATHESVVGELIELSERISEQISHGRVSGGS